MRIQVAVKVELFFKWIKTIFMKYRDNQLWGQMKQIYLGAADTPYLLVKEKKDDVYVSDYSNLLIDNLPASLNDKIICDYGCGTGIISLCSCAKRAKKVIAIDTNEYYLKLTERNISNNVNPQLVELYPSGCEFIKKSNCYFDYIFCNPASLPSIVGDKSFYNGGEWGLNMILEVVEFSYNKLKEDGHLLILITSILPTSLFHDCLIKLNLKCAIVATKLIKFRKHYEKIKEWVDNNEKDYPEMVYFDERGTLFEKVIVYDVQRA
jgi:precorrin-6B methylase 2